MPATSDWILTRSTSSTWHICYHTPSVITGVISLYWTQTLSRGTIITANSIYKTWKKSLCLSHGVYGTERFCKKISFDKYTRILVCDQISNAFFTVWPIKIYTTIVEKKRSVYRCCTCVRFRKTENTDDKIQQNKLSFAPEIRQAKNVT